MKLIPKRKTSVVSPPSLIDGSQIGPRTIIGDKLSVFSTIYGNGDDGDVTVSGATTLTGDMVYENLTVMAGVTLSTDGYCVYVKDTLTLNGTISANGNDASGATPGAAGNGALAGAAGGVTPDSKPGGGGGGGGHSLIVACKILKGDGTISADGGTGGDGAQPNDGRTGGAGTGVTKGGAAGGAGGAGGGGGGGAGGTTTKPTVSPHLVEDGGAGGGAGGTSYTNASYWGAGGGGGGGAGLVFLFYRTKTGQPTTSVNGGSIGSGASAGGETGADGSAGSAGKLYEAKTL